MAATGISSATTTRTADTLLAGDNFPLGTGGKGKIAASELLEGLARLTGDAAAVRTLLGLPTIATRKVQLLSEITGVSTSDGAAATNTSAVNALLAAGYTVVADKGVYPVTQLVIPAAGGCGLMGVDPYGTGFKSANGANATMIVCGPADGVGAIYPAAPAGTKGNGVFLKDLFLDFNRANNSTTGDPRGGNFAGQVVYNSVWWLNGIRLHDLDKILIENCTLVESPTFFTLFHDCTNVMIRGNRTICATRGYQTSGINQDGFHFDGGCSDVWVVGNNIQSNDDSVAINLAEGTGRRGKRFYVLNNTIDDSFSIARVYGTQNAGNLIPPASLPESNQTDQVLIAGNTGSVYDRGVNVGLETAVGQVNNHNRVVVVADNQIDCRGNFVQVHSTAEVVSVVGNVVRPRGPGYVAEADAYLLYVSNSRQLASAEVRENTVFRDQTNGIGLFRAGDSNAGAIVGSATVSGNRVTGPFASFLTTGPAPYSGRAARAAAVVLLGTSGQPCYVDRLAVRDNDLHGYEAIVHGTHADLNELAVQANRFQSGSAPSVSPRVYLTGSSAVCRRLTSDGTTGPADPGPVFEVASGASVTRAGGDDFLRCGQALTDVQALPGTLFKASDHSNAMAVRVGDIISTIDLTSAADLTPSAPTGILYKWESYFEDAGGSDACEAGDGVYYLASNPTGRELVQATAGSRPTYRAAVAGGRLPYMDFDGGDSLSGATITGFPSSSAARTTRLWFKLPAGYAGNTVFFGYGPNTGGNCWLLGFFTSNLAVTQNGAAVFATGTFNDGSWHLLTVTYDGTTAKVYVDGVLRNSGALTVNTTLTGSLSIGTGYGSSTMPSGGGLAGIQLDDAAWTASEVAADYATAAVP